MNKTFGDDVEQPDLFDDDSKMADKPYYSSKALILENLKEKERQRQKNIEEQMRKEIEAECDDMYELFDYIKNNNPAIKIPETKVISHDKHLQEIHLYLKYPEFPKKSEEDKNYSKDALEFYRDTLELWAFEPTFISLWTGPLGGIRTRDKESREYGVSAEVAHGGDLMQSDYFDGTKMFWSESVYCDDFWSDYQWDLGDEGIDIRWSYPPYFQIFEESLSNYSRAIWNHFVANWLEY